MTREHVLRAFSSLEALVAAEKERRLEVEERANAEWSAWLASELGQVDL